MSTDSGQADPKQEAERATNEPNVWRDHAIPFAQWLWSFPRAIFCYLAQAVRDPSSLPGFLIASFTLLLAIFALFAWQEARNASEIAHQQLLAGDAAFVFIDGIEFQPSQSTNVLTWYVIPKWKNSGNTRTDGLQTWVNFGVLNPIIPGFTNYDISASGINVGARFDLGPHANSQIAYFDLPPTTFALMPEKRGQLMIWGHASYRDVFPGTKPHITRFCYEVASWRGKPTDASIGTDGTPAFRPILRLCDEGNCADEECKK